MTFDWRENDSSPSIAKTKNTAEVIQFLLILAHTEVIYLRLVTLLLMLGYQEEHLEQMVLQ